MKNRMIAAAALLAVLSLLLFTLAVPLAFADSEDPASGQPSEFETTLPKDQTNERVRLVIIIVISTVVIAEIGAAVVVMSIKSSREKEKFEKELAEIRSVSFKSGDNDPPKNNGDEQK